jgi:hypothetical protein
MADENETTTQETTATATGEALDIGSGQASAETETPAPTGSRTAEEQLQDMRDAGTMDGRVLNILGELLERVTALEEIATAAANKTTTK